MKDRISLDGIIDGVSVLDQRGVQERLYNNVLWGCYNNEGIKISKLELNIQGLFPFDIGHWRLEYGKVEICISSRTMDVFGLILDVIQYSIDKKITFISQKLELNIPLVILPSLTKHNTVLVDGVKKTLIMQLVRDITVMFDKDNGVINMTTKSSKRLGIQGSRIKYGDYESDLFATMLKLKSKYSHILKNILELEHLVYFNGRWRKLYWTSSGSNINSSKYGQRRLFRQIKTMTECYDKNKVISTCFVVNKFGNIVIKMGDELDLDTNLALRYTSVLRVTTTTKSSDLKLLKHIGCLICLNLCYTSDIVSDNIMDVDLTLIGRCTLNDITCDKQDFGLDLLTKKDLISIWNRYAIKRTSLRPINCDIKVIKGSGDYLIDVIYTSLVSVLNSWVAKQSLEQSKGITTFDSDNVIIKGLLHINEDIQKRVNKYFNSSDLCQYSEQVNSLSELSHKNKITCMGKGGLTQQNADNYARDTKTWHYGKICPIESPEGQNIGLILSLAFCSNIDVNGHIITGYFKTYNGLVSNNVVYLNYYECKGLRVSLPHWNNSSKWILCLHQDKTVVVDKRSVELTLISEAQVFSSAVCLIPFLGYNDPTRALMASNMLKQAIPLLKPQAPMVGTGEEYNVMRSAGDNVTAIDDGMVISVDSSKVLVYESKKHKHRFYGLPVIEKTNQETCQRVRVVVNPGQMIKSGDVIAECQSSCNGEMSLGANLLAAFMCWRGYNFEDSVILSESVIKKGTFKSIHIIDFETKVMKTEHGNEWLSADIIEIPMKYRRCLDSNGIVKVGSNVQENDVLVGKLVPRFDAKRKKEEFKEICGYELSSDKEINDDNGMITNIEEDDYVLEREQDRDDEFSTELVRNTSLRVPNGIEYAIVLEVKRSSDKDKVYKDKDLKEYIHCYNLVTKKYIRRCCMLLQIDNIKWPFTTSLFSSDDKVIQSGLNLLYKNYLSYLNKLEVNMLSKFNKRLTNKSQDNEEKILETIKIKLLVYKSIKVGDKICGRHGNKGVISKIVPKEDMPFMADGTPIDIILNPLGIPSRMNIGQILETNFGLISYKLGLEFKHVLNMYNKTNDDRILKRVIPKLTELYPNIKDLSKDMILILLDKLSQGVKISCPLVKSPFESCLKNYNKRLSINSDGKFQLYDGITGLPFRNKTTVGILYIFKLNHLVDDKLHARSIGPYSIVTQQPLKGKSHKGGQRLGEMEVWALQSYGTSYFLRELITVKCDDMSARTEIRNNIMHGNLRCKAYQNEGILVVIKELFAMCIDIKLKIE
ncbi:DNA-directed RNA polymerase subunit beta [Candidatus Hodgkinia cicadicola]|uniref:DNA-directed RNA polymerase subunit beta n=1 Tax=Candidatus Hodgkinia cicadicola TaxID=573658 RepID=A0ABX4MFL6_9HYPH|nr:DNA-directed RNA polymerase subunit beta [Candidatus Hodgkinia cicadicola]